MLYCTDITTYPYNNTGLVSNVSVETIKGLRCSIMELYHTKLDCSCPLASDYYLLDEVCGFTSLNNFIENIYDVYNQGVVVYCGTDTTPGTLPETSVNAVYVCRHTAADSYDDYYWNIYLGCDGGYINTGINLLSCYNYPNRICGVGLSGENVCLNATCNYYIGTQSHVNATGSDTYTGIWGNINCRSSGFKAESTNDYNAWYGYSKCTTNDHSWFFGECFKCNYTSYNTYIKGIFSNSERGVCLGQFRPYGDNYVYRCNYNKRDDIGLIKLNQDVCVITNNCMWPNCDITIHCFSSNVECCEGRLYVSQDNGCNWHKYVLDCELCNFTNCTANLCINCLYVKDCLQVMENAFIDNDLLVCGDLCVNNILPENAAAGAVSIDNLVTEYVEVYYDLCTSHILPRTNNTVLIEGTIDTTCVYVDCDVVSCYVCTDDLRAHNSIFDGDMTIDSADLDIIEGYLRINCEGEGEISISGNSVNFINDSKICTTSDHLNVAIGNNNKQFRFCCDGHIYFNGNRLI